MMRVGRIRPGDVVVAQPLTVARTVFEQDGGVTLQFTDGSSKAFAKAEDAVEVVGVLDAGAAT